VKMSSPGYLGAGSILAAVTLAALLGVAGGAVATDHPDECEEEGPDAFEYRCSLDAEFEFADMEDSTEVSLGIDDRTGAIELPFSFPWYERSVSEVYISSNGKICFSLDGEDCSEWQTQSVPSTNEPNDLAACAWDDYDPTQGGTIHYNATTVNDGGTDAFVVEYKDVPHYTWNDENTFQLQLLEDGKVRCMVDELEDKSEPTTIGIENETGEEGVRYTSTSFATEDENLAVIFGQAPAAPETVDTDPHIQSINVTWAPVDDDLDHYTVYKRSTPNGNAMTFEVQPNKTYYNDTDLDHEETAYYEVSANNSLGEGPLSEQVKDTSYGEPSMPQEVTAAPGSDRGEIDLEWAVPADRNATNEYSIYVNATDGSDELLDTVDAGTTSYTSENHTLGFEYTFDITATNDAGEGPAGTDTSYPAGNNTPPTPPRDLTADHGSETGEVDLAWTEPAQPNGTRYYHVYREGAGQIANLSAGQTSFTDTGLETGQTYTYNVTALAYSSVGESNASAPATSAPKGEPTPPQEATAEHDPDNPADDTVGAVVVEWTPPTDDGGAPLQAYEIRRAVDGGDFGFRASVEPNETSFADDEIDCREAYEYRILAENEEGKSDPDNATATVEGICPGAPQDLLATEDGDAKAIAVEWRPPKDSGKFDISRYKVERANATSDFEEIASVPASDDLRVDDDDLACGERYDYRVTARNKAGLGEPAAASETVEDACPTQPRTASATAGDNGDDTPATDEIQLSWDPPTSSGWAELDEYRILHCNPAEHPCTNPATGTNWTASGTVDADGELNFTATAEEGETIAFAVAASNQLVDGVGAYSDVTDATAAEAPTPPENVTAESEPASDEVVVNWTAPADDGGASVLTYHIYERNATEGEDAWREIGTVPAETTEFSYTPSGSGAFCYTVSANNTFESEKADVEQPFDQEKCVAALAGLGGLLPDVRLECEGTLTAVPVVCPQPPEDVQTTVENTTIELSWTSPDDVEPNGYEIQRTTESLDSGEAECGDFGTINTTTSTTYDDEDLDPGTAYCYRVIAYRGVTVPVVDQSIRVAESQPSPNATATTAARPGPVVNLDAVAPDGSLGTLNLTWERPDANGSEIEHYTAYEDRSCTGETDRTVTVDPSGKSEESLNLTDLPAGDYCLAVTATNGVGESDPVNASASVDNNPPAPPSGIEAEADDGNIAVSWSDPEDTGGSELVNLTVERSDASQDAWSTAATVDPGAETYTDDDLAEGVEFCYRIVATNTGLADDGTETEGLDSDPSKVVCKEA